MLYLTYKGNYQDAKKYPEKITEEMLEDNGCQGHAQGYLSLPSPSVFTTKHLVNQIKIYVGYSKSVQKSDYSMSLCLSIEAM